MSDCETKIQGRLRELLLELADQYPEQAESLLQALNTKGVSVLEQIEKERTLEQLSVFSDVFAEAGAEGVAAQINSIAAILQTGQFEMDADAAVKEVLTTVDGLKVVTYDATPGQEYLGMELTKDDGTVVAMVESAPIDGLVLSSTSFVTKMDENFDFIKGVLEHALHPSEHGGEESLSRPLCTPPKPHQQQEYRKQVQMV